MKKIIIALTMILCFAGINNMQAQNYKSAVGAKLGWGLIGSYKTFLSESNALEVFAGFRWSGLGAGAFYQIHKDINEVDNLQWFIGGGASVTTWSYGFTGLGSYAEVGLHFDIGLEYTFTDIPLNVSLDYAPGFVVFDTWDYTGTYSRLRLGYGSLTARYILKR